MKFPDNPRKILLLRFSSMGDVIQTMHIPRHLKAAFQGCQVVMVVRREFQTLVEANPHLDEKIYFDRNTGFHGLMKLVDKLKLMDFDLVIDLHEENSTRTVFPEPV